MSGKDPGPHNGVGPGGVGKVQSVNASSTVLRLSAATAFLFGVKVADMKKESTVKHFCPLTGDRRNEARERTPCKTHPCSPSMT